MAAGRWLSCEAGLMNSNQGEKGGFVSGVIAWSVHNQLLVMLFVLSLLVAGIKAVQEMPLDAIPDMSDTQVIIRTEFGGKPLR